MSVRFAAVLLAALLALAACAGRPVGTHAGRPAPNDRAQQAPSPSAAAVPSASHLPAASGARLPTSAPTQTSTGGLTFVPIDLRVSVSPACASKAQSVRVDVETIPRADVAVAAVFSDEDSHQTYAMLAAGPDGRAVWTFAVPISAPSGRAEVLVAAQDSNPISGKPHQQGTASKEFRVAPPGGC